MTDQSEQAEHPRVRLERYLPVARADVFEAFTRPEILARWWGPPGVESTDAKIDLRIDGAYRFASRAGDGSNHTVIGTYREIEPPARLVFTWSWEGMEGPESVVRIELSEEKGGTRLVLEHDGLPEPMRATHRKGWIHVLDRLHEMQPKE